MRVARRPAIWSGALAAVFGVCWGCEAPSEEPGDRATPFVTRDSVGIEIVENKSPLWTDQTRWTVALEPEVVITSDEADYDRIFSKIGDVVRLSDGRVVLESQLTRQLFVYGPTGDLLDRWGGVGEGPQEFREIDGMFRCVGDTLVVRDGAHLAVVYPTGHLGRRIRIRPELGASSAVQLRGISSDCGAALITVQQPNLVPTHLGTVSAQRLTVWASLSGPEIDTLGMFQGEERFMHEGYARLFPFHTMPSWATDGFRLYFGIGDQPEIRVLGSRGQVVRLIRWDVEPEPIPESEWRAYAEDRVQFLEWDPGSAFTTTPPGVHPRPAWQPIYSAEGDHRRYESGFRFDGEGNLWVRRGRREPLLSRVSQERPKRPPDRWWVFDSAGHWLGEIKTPANLLVKYISGGLLLGVSWDDLDVEEVRAYRIERPEAG